MSLRKSPLLLAAICLLPLVTGCMGGSSGGEVDVYPVTGKITTGGSPVPNASVSFTPLDGQPIAIGRTDSEGVYNLTTYDANDGAAEGSYIVLVMKTGGSTKEEMSDEDMHAAMEAGKDVGAQHGGGQAGATDDGPTNLLNQKYSSPGSSDLEASVTKDGENKFDFDLDT